MKCFAGLKWPNDAMVAAIFMRLLCDVLRHSGASPWRIAATLAPWPHAAMHLNHDENIPSQQKLQGKSSTCWIWNHSWSQVSTLHREGWISAWEWPHIAMWCAPSAAMFQLWHIAVIAAQNRSSESQLRIAAQNRSSESQLRIADQNRRSESQFRITAQNRSSESQLRIAAQNRSSESQLRIAAQNRSSELQLRIAAQNRSSESQLRIAVQNHSSESQLRIAAQNRSSESQLRIAAQNRSSESQLRIAAKIVACGDSGTGKVVRISFANSFFNLLWQEGRPWECTLINDQSVISIFILGLLIITISYDVCNRHCSYWNLSEKMRKYGTKRQKVQ